MKINFDYDKKKIQFSSGHIFKGKDYRCSYITYDTLYRNPAYGSEQVQIYNYEPKNEIRASSLILHGLGSNNIKFLLWLGPHLASAGVNTSIMILPGNYTRVENKSMSGRSFLYPDINILYQFWENAVIDVRSTIDLLEYMNLWKKNNILIGYCLGGMISSIVNSLDNRISHTLFMTTGGVIPKIIHESPVGGFARRMFESDMKFNYHLNDKDKLYSIYEKQFPQIRNMSLNKLINNSKIHPLLKIDPISYAHFLDKNKITFVDAFFDSTLPRESRKVLYNEMKGAKRKILPISHINWLPFSYPLAKYILYKVKITDKESQRSLLSKKNIDNPLNK